MYQKHLLIIFNEEQKKKKQKKENILLKIKNLFKKTKKNKNNKQDKKDRDIKNKRKITKQNLKDIESFNTEQNKNKTKNKKNMPFIVKIFFIILVIAIIIIIIRIYNQNTKTEINADAVKNIPTYTSTQNNYNNSANNKVTTNNNLSTNVSMENTKNKAIKVIPKNETKNSNKNMSLLFDKKCAYFKQNNKFLIGLNNILYINDNEYYPNKLYNFFDLSQNDKFKIKVNKFISPKIIQFKIEDEKDKTKSCLVNVNAFENLKFIPYFQSVDIKENNTNKKILYTIGESFTFGMKIKDIQIYPNKKDIIIETPIGDYNISIKKENK